MRQNLLFIVLFFAFTACKTTYVTVQVLKPAHITIPSKINNLVFVNRSLPAKSERFKNILEGAVTGEAILADRIGAEECIKGVIANLNESPRYKAVAPGNINLKGTGTREFPPALEWDIVEDICKQNQADALITLETFDSNNSVEIGERQAERKDGQRTIKYVEFIATLHVQVESGWRIYYPAEKRIIDQNVYNDAQSWSNTSDARKRAEAGLPLIENAVGDAGFYAGKQYAFRISPMWTNVSRYYFNKGNVDFERADRFGKSGDWKGAADIWIKYVNNSDPKIAGNACYNMALAQELEGNLEEALDWARKSYTKFNNKKGRYYANILQQRIYDQSRLDEQMQKN
jgi:tetratricopeptide (TPR) repeat protein